MSIWGKLLGGAAGFALGGPLGALLGAVAGHVADAVAEAVSEAASSEKHPTASITYTIGVIALSAKMAKADGRATDAEFKLFQRLYQIPPDEVGNVTRLYNMAREDVAGYDAYARQIVGLLRDHPALLEDILDNLFFIALADDALHEAELEYLRSVADIFGFRGADFDRIRASHAGLDVTNPYEILGLFSDASDAEVKLAYRRLAKEHHPDHLIAEGVPTEFVRASNDKLAAINAAYRQIRVARGQV